MRVEEPGVAVHFCLAFFWIVARVQISWAVPL
jgi:hypothetical protein